LLGSGNWLRSRHRAGNCDLSLGAVSLPWVLRTIH
jgi:hypothetical protein